ncbi:MAG: sigma-70 family RNA polymerase sigma factor [Clostridiales bacterium]|nr:sigma-70 family RNA polymerase sigma factor [Clostridiales bacterium]
MPKQKNADSIYGVKGANMAVHIRKPPDEEAGERLLIKRSQKGDTAAFEELALAYQKLIYNIAVRMLGNAEDAADMTQETLLKIYRALPKYRGDAAFSTWVYRITANTCRDMMRRNRKHQEALWVDFAGDDNDESNLREVADYSAIPEDILLAKESEGYLNALINGLSPKYRMIITMREISGLGYQEIADAAGISIGTVKSRLARARQCMREQILANAEQYPHLLRLIGQRGNQDGLR